MKIFYNDVDPGCCEWLSKLVKANLIPEGKIDGQSIVGLRAADLMGFNRVHLFAGIGGWERALQLAGWPEDESVWTGSCPCPPFSNAGKKKRCPECCCENLISHPFKTGIFVCCECFYEWEADGRHLWPEFRRLIEECRPGYIFGEQVSSKDGRVWLSGVHATLEKMGYGFWAVDTCSAGVNSPNIRQRLFWVAYNKTPRQLRKEELENNKENCRTGWRFNTSNTSKIRSCFGMGNTKSSNGKVSEKQWESSLESGGTSRSSFWSDFKYIDCQDGKTRRIPTESPLFRLATGVFSGMDFSNGELTMFPLAKRMKKHRILLSGIGNAINPIVASEFIKTFMEIL